MIQRSLTVGFDAHTLGKKATGNEAYAAGLISGFAKQQNIDFTLYLSQQNKILESHFNAKQVSNSSIKRLSYDFPLLLATDKPDIVHFQYISPIFCSVPTVLTVHDLSYLHHPECFPLAMRKRLEWLVPRAIANAAHIVTPSQTSKEDVINTYGLHESFVSVVHNGVSDIFAPASEQEQARVRTKFSCQKPYFIIVGALQPRKNLKRVFKAYADAIASGQLDIDMVVVGPQRWNQHCVLDLAKELGISERTNVAGYVDDIDLVALYSAAQFSIYASLFEGFGLPIVESMACGTPVITSNTSCMPEVAGGAALLVDPTDQHSIMESLIELSNSAQLCEQLKQKGLVNSGKYRWDSAAKKMCGIYHSVAQTASLHVPENG